MTTDDHIRWPQERAEFVSSAPSLAEAEPEDVEGCFTVIREQLAHLNEHLGSYQTQTGHDAGRDQSIPEESSDDALFHANG